MTRILTSNWKDGAYAGNASTKKQLLAFFTIIGQLVLGGQVAFSGENTALGAITLAYAGSNALGYYNLGGAPLVKLARVNMVSIICALLAAGSLYTGGFALPIFYLFTSFIQDTFLAAQPRDTTELGREQTEEDIDAEMTPIERFVVTSWKNSGIQDSKNENK